ncbi:M20/M25/M40 family metallo-hydrolase [bacterium]|nr:M20/M25/M40 family metallo-hydrolase [bacterium]
MIKEIVDLTKVLVQFQTVHSKPAEIIRCADFIEEYLKNIPVHYQRINQNNTPSFLVTPDSGVSTVLLMSHFDVVEGADHLFQPFEENGRLYGRGVLDDKYAVALSLVLLKTHIKRLEKLGLTQKHLSFGILLTGDEEAGGTDGANHVLPSVKTDFCIALDGGSLDEIITKEKGILLIKLINKGRASHSARPWLGDNAVDRLIADYQVIKTFFDLTTPDNWHRTLNLSTINAGKSHNQVPDYAEAIMDVRYTEYDDMDELIVQIRQKIQGELVVLRKDPLFFGHSTRYLDMLADSNAEIRITAEHGSSDARYLSAYGINGIVWGANGNLSHHSEKEHIEIESISMLYERLDSFLQKNSEMN